MLEYLRGKVSDRKLRWFMVACCRWAWEQLTLPESRQIVVAVEASIDQLLGDVGIALAARTPTKNRLGGGNQLVRYLVEEDAQAGGRSMAIMAPRTCVTRQQHTWGTGYKALGQIVRDIFNPFRPVTVPPACVTAQVVAVAQAAYDERKLPWGILDVARLMVLADALEDAGCDQADLLGHLRSPGPHVRGCWPLDLLLGKE
jgi:hypothetical protein